MSTSATLITFMYPLRAKTAYTETLNDELCVYEWTRYEVHALNATAASVWQLCDGKTSVAEIVDRLRPQLPHAEHVVALALEEFRKKQLLDVDHGLTRPAAAFSRREAVRIGLTALPIVTSIVAPTPLQAQSPSAPTGSQTFNFTGAAQTFVVPARVTSLTVTAFGAQGNFRTVANNRPGGLGGVVTATLAVTPGEVLVITVGGGGQDTNVGGFNGGGPAGAAGSGGGASDVRRGSTLADWIVVAGGGGGGGSRGPNPSGADGGLGGGTTGGDGSPAGTGGQGGSQVAGGAGGTLLTTGHSGTAGTLGMGGTGATCCPGALPGGGGGGGYFGGGGGASDDHASGGGGGGGASFAQPSATGVVHAQGVRAGAGLITLAW